MAGAFQANAFQNNAFQTGAAPPIPQAAVYYGGGWEPRHYRRDPDFWEREDVQEVVAQAITVAKKPSPKPRLNALRAEVVALAQTVALRDEARSQFFDYVAAEARRRDDETALLFLLTD